MNTHDSFVCKYFLQVDKMSNEILEIFIHIYVQLFIHVL